MTSGIDLDIDQHANAPSDVRSNSDRSHNSQTQGYCGQPEHPLTCGGNRLPIVCAALGISRLRARANRALFVIDGCGRCGVVSICAVRSQPGADRTAALRTIVPLGAISTVMLSASISAARLNASSMVDRDSENALAEDFPIRTVVSPWLNSGLGSTSPVC